MKKYEEKREGSREEKEETRGMHLRRRMHLRRTRMHLRRSLKEEIHLGKELLRELTYASSQLACFLRCAKNFIIKDRKVEG